MYHSRQNNYLNGRDKVLLFLESNLKKSTEFLEVSTFRLLRWHPLVNGNRKYRPGVRSNLAHHFYKNIKN